MDSARSAALVKSLRAVLNSPQNRTAIYDVPEQDLLLARTETRLLIGPKGHAELFNAVIPNLKAAIDKPLATAEQPLSDDPAMVSCEGCGVQRQGTQTHWAHGAVTRCGREPVRIVDTEDALTCGDCRRLLGLRTVTTE